MLLICTRTKTLTQPYNDTLGPYVICHRERNHSGDDVEDDKWEEELQKDLQEFELVSGDVSALDEEALDDDIMELRNSGNQKT